MLIECETVSGSVYEVDLEHMRARLLQTHEKNGSNRITAEWRSYVDLGFDGVGSSLRFCWGWGTDESSETAVQIRVGGDGDEVRQRWTVTSPVVAIRTAVS